MNFGQHIERAITNFGLSLENIQQRHHDWNEESKALGLISDEEKLRMLKRDLYYEVRLSNPNQQKILNITSAIEHLEEIKQAEFDRKQEQIKLNLTLPAQINQSLNAFLVFGLLAVIGSYVATPICDNNQSKFCDYARGTVYTINKFFKD